MLFNLVMDPLLTELRETSLGISIIGLFLGAFAHADHFRTMASNMEDATEQASVVYCALLPSSNRLTPLSLDVNNEVSLPVEKSVKCLGVWWDTTSLSNRMSVNERIQKASLPTVNWVPSMVFSTPCQSLRAAFSPSYYMALKCGCSILHY